MKRLSAIMIIFLGASALTFAQSAQSSRKSAPAALDRVFIELAAPGGRERLLHVLSGISAQQLTKAADIDSAYSSRIKKDQAEINIRKAELTRALLDSHPDMKRVEQILRAATDWEYQMRLFEIERDIKVREYLGDRNWSRYRVARRLLEDLDQMRIQELATGGAANGQHVRQLSARERTLLRQLEGLTAQLDRGQ